MRVLENYVNGRWVALAGDTVATESPATGEELALVPLSGESDVEAAVAAAAAAFPGWRDVPPPERVRRLARFRGLLESSLEDIARTLTMERGTPLDEARNSVRVGLDAVELALTAPSLLFGDSAEGVAVDVDCDYVRQPLGVFAALAAEELPAVAPLWFWPLAVACGNTVVYRAARGVAITQTLLFELAHQAGFPPGVVNLVHGDERVDGWLLDNAAVVGMSVAGVPTKARQLFSSLSARGKRAQAVMRGNRSVVVMPDCRLEEAVGGIVHGALLCSGQRSAPGARIVGVGPVYEVLRSRLVDVAANLQLGNGVCSRVDLGPLASAEQAARCRQYVERAVAAGAKPILDGRSATVDSYPEGPWLGATILEGTPPAELAGELDIGPVLWLSPAPTLAAAMEELASVEMVTGASIFTTSGVDARQFRHRAGAGTIGINCIPPTPIAFATFGSGHSSLIGDARLLGRDAVRFFTDARVVTSRWFAPAE